MNYLSLLIWVGQFGFSILFPTCAFLMLGVWLRARFGWSLGIVILLGVLGLLTSFSTARSCLRAILKEIQRHSDRREPPATFHDHN